MSHSDGLFLICPRTAQAAMRHSSLDLTMNVYTDPTLLDVAGAIETLPDLSLESDSAAVRHPQLAHASIGTVVIPRVAAAVSHAVLSGSSVSGRNRGLLLRREVIQGDNLPGVQRLYGRGNDRLRCQAVSSGTVYFLGRRPGGNLVEKGVNPRPEGIIEIAIPAEDRVCVNRLQRVACRIQRRLAPHVVENEAALHSRHFAALHRMTALDIVAAGQVPHHAVDELHIP